MVNCGVSIRVNDNAYSVRRLLRIVIIGRALSIASLTGSDAVAKKPAGRVAAPFGPRSNLFALRTDLASVRLRELDDW